MLWKSILKVLIFVIMIILLVLYANLWMQCFRAEMSWVGMTLISVVIVMWLTMPLRYFTELKRSFSLFGYIKYLIADFGLAMAWLGKLVMLWLTIVLNILRLKPFDDKK